MVFIKNSKSPPMFKSIIPLLLPFFKTSALYFILSDHLIDYKVLLSILKCAPIIVLAMFVISRCYASRCCTNYQILVTIGLLTSTCGDIFLVYTLEGYLIHGIITFGIAQLVYTCAFGFHNFNFKVAGVLVTTGLSFYYLLYPNLTGIVAIILPIYIFMLGCMIWRATSRAECPKHELCISKLFPAIGSILFMISDGLLGLSLFKVISFVGCNNAIMFTYYGAQLFIALSCVDPYSIQKNL